MSQVPVHTRKTETTRNELWKTIRKLKSFTFSQVYMAAKCSKGIAREYLAGLTAAGYLQRHPELGYVLVRDVGVDAPRVRKDGSECMQGKGREQIWTVLPILKEFSTRDVVVHASTEFVSVSESTVKEYLKYLHKAGYLILSRTSRPGHKPGTGQQMRYRFLQSKYTGPKAPMVQRTRQVYDANIGKVVWSKEGADE